MNILDKVRVLQNTEKHRLTRFWGIGAVGYCLVYAEKRCFVRFWGLLWPISATSWVALGRLEGLDLAGRAALEVGPDEYGEGGPPLGDTM